MPERTRLQLQSYERASFASEFLKKNIEAMSILPFLSVKFFLAILCFQPTNIYVPKREKSNHFWYVQLDSFINFSDKHLNYFINSVKELTTEASTFLSYFDRKRKVPSTETEVT